VVQAESLGVHFAEQPPGRAAGRAFGNGCSWESCAAESRVGGLFLGGRSLDQSLARTAFGFAWVCFGFCPTRAFCPHFFVHCSNSKNNGAPASMRLLLINASALLLTGCPHTSCNLASIAVLLAGQRAAGDLGAFVLAAAERQLSAFGRLLASFVAPAPVHAGSVQ
jgi:hypothetical protein